MMGSSLEKRNKKGILAGPYIFVKMNILPYQYYSILSTTFLILRLYLALLTQIVVMEITKSDLERKLVELTSEAIKAEDHTNPWMQFHEDCMSEIQAEKDRDYKIQCTELYVCSKCKKNPCPWSSAGIEMLPMVQEYVEENGGKGSDGA